MKKIFKYELRVTDEQSISMPDDAEILSVVVQNEHIFVYALVTPVELGGCYTTRDFHIYGTGNPIEDTARLEDDFYFIGTVKTQGGLFVWHIFAEKSF